MNRYNIPASITLAQGILESGNGESMLAVEGKNHFGIKCHDNWNGATIIEDDDETDPKVKDISGKVTECGNGVIETDTGEVCDGNTNDE